MGASVLLASWLCEALERAAARRGAWTRRSLRMRGTDLDVLVSAGYVRRIGGTRDGVSLYEITDAGRGVVARGGRT